MNNDTKIFLRWIVATVAAALLLLLVGGSWFYRSQEQTLRQKAIDELTSIGRLKADQITTWCKERLADAAILVESPFFIRGLADFMIDPDEKKTKELFAHFESLQKNYLYSDILLVSPDERVLISLTGEAKIHRGYRAALTAALQNRKPLFTEIHTETQKPEPHISVIAPIFASREKGADLLGSVILVSDASLFLYPLIQSWPTQSRSAETLLVQRDRDEVLFLNELRHKRDTALKLRMPLSRTDLPAVMAVLGRQGFAEGRDYRGVDVLSVLIPIPDSPWFMVSKQDSEEIIAEWRSRSKLILGLLTALAASIGAIGLVAWQRHRKASYRQMYISEAELRTAMERHSVTLKAIGDAVISTDAQGNVELLNPVAELLTGWSHEEACGLPLGEIFHIISEETREISENPVSKVLSDGAVVGLANHTLLISRDGTEFPIADSAAPIHSAEGEISGVVLVFRDQSAERSAITTLQNSEKRYRSLFETAQDGILILDFETGRVLDANPFLLKLLDYSYEELCGKSLWELGLLKESAEFREPFQTLKDNDYIRYNDMQLCTRSKECIDVEFISNVYMVDNNRVIQCNIRDISERKRDEAEHKRLMAQLQQAQKMESVGRLAGGVAHDFNNMLSVIIGYAELGMERTEPSEPLHNDLQEILNAARRSADIVRQLLAFARKQTIAPQVLDLNETVEGILKMLRRLIGEDISLSWLPGKEVWPVRMDPSQIDQILANLCVNARDAISGVGKITIETGTVTFDEAYCADHAGFIPGDFVLLAVSDNGCGMDRNTLENLFEPFFTTKEMGKGTGLGLATVYGIVKQNNSFINVYSEPGQGTTFRIYLTRYAGSSRHVETESTLLIPSGHGNTVLIVEDEVAILKLSRTMLERLGYTVLAAATPDEAMRMAEEHAGQIDLLMTDVVMPQMNGRDLARRLMELYPDLKLLFMSGYTANVIAHHGVLDEGVQFIQKPFSMRDIAIKVRQALGQK